MKPLDLESFERVFDFRFSTKAEDFIVIEPDEKYDLVSISRLLHHFDCLDIRVEVFNQALRTIKTGGLAYVSVAGFDLEGSRKSGFTPLNLKTENPLEFYPSTIKLNRSTIKVLSRND